MSSDFSAKGRSARELIPVPELPLDAIRSRSRAARARGRMQAVIACAAISLGAIGAGTGLGEKLYDGVRVWLSGDKVAMTMTSFVMVRQPTAADLRGAIAGATFPVIFPVGIPAGSRVYLLAASPPGHPSAIVVSYHDHAGRDGSTFVLIDPKVVDADGGGVEKTSARFGTVSNWRTGGEIVLASRRGTAAGDVDRIKAAMAESSPRASMAVVDTMLAKVAVLGGPNRLELAERSIRAPGAACFSTSSRCARSRASPRAARRFATGGRSTPRKSPTRTARWSTARWRARHRRSSPSRRTACALSTRCCDPPAAIAGARCFSTSPVPARIGSGKSRCRARLRQRSTRSMRGRSR